MDMKPFRNSMQQMGKIERTLQKELSKTLRDAHGTMASAISAEGVQNPRLLGELNRIIDNTAQRATVIWQAQAVRVTATANTLIEAQVGPELAAQARAIATATPAGTAAPWAASARATMMSDLLRVLNEAPDDAIRALMGISNAASGGRASAYDALVRQMGTWAQQTTWRTYNGHLLNNYQAIDEVSPIRFRRQAIAAIDSRTTDCCLNVHGQIVGMDQPFRLTGTPRFASHMMAPPFHYNCRTATALYEPGMEKLGLTTASMRADVRNELLERGKPKQKPPKAWTYDLSKTLAENDADYLEFMKGKVKVDRRNRRSALKAARTRAENKRLREREAAEREREAAEEAGRDDGD